ncbi:DUF397 domain-containing protein [Embleya sp. NBC_00896]|uniref:DUF397 domain-containing protein n=1 Tax=Embleya sp. NBC_00896 TaxID=2975961 RepID=UPI00386FA6D7|nr:DUF397 domain-containing protein [Embleya sp. NBC_00896]
MDKTELYEADLTHAVWIKASASNQNGTCVELAAVADGVAMRDSKNLELPALRYTREELAAFIAGAKAGEFDHLI